MTIRKNTKAHSAAIAGAKGVRVYSLGNNFEGKEIPGPISAFDIESGKLVLRGETYSLRVHSNLWYEWEAA